MKFLSEDFTFSKRLLGIVMVIGGILGTIGLLVLDAITATEEGGIGPAQRTAIVVMIVVTIIGLTLIPLGHDPA